MILDFHSDQSMRSISGASSDNQTRSIQEHLSRSMHRALQLPLGHAHVDDLFDHALDSVIIPPRGRHSHNWDEFHGDTLPEHTDRDTVLQQQVPPYTPSSDYPILDISYLLRIQSPSSTQCPTLKMSPRVPLPCLIA